MGSDSDLEIMREAGKALDDFGIAYEIDVTSAHRSPDRTADFARKAAGRGIRVIIAGAGGAAHLAGVIAAHTTLAGDRRADSFDFAARNGFVAGDRADAGGDSGGDGGDREAGRDERGDSGGADDWRWPMRRSRKSWTRTKKSWREGVEEKSKKLQERSRVASWRMDSQMRRGTHSRLRCGARVADDKDAAILARAARAGMQSLTRASVPSNIRGTARPDPSRFRANSTVAFRKPSLSPVSWRRPSKT